MSAELGGYVNFQYETGLKEPWLKPLRYLVQGWKTWRLLEQEQPEAVLVQVPPIFAGLTVAIWCELRSKTRHLKLPIPYVLDCHGSTFYSYAWRWGLPLLRLLSRRAVVTLVACEDALRILRCWKVKGIFLVDGIPTLKQASGTIGALGEARVAVICSFDHDEPLFEVFSAARLLPQVTFYISGDSGRVAPKLLVQKPENIIMTGFLPDNAYIGLLKNVHGLVVLTKEVNVLNCGAYEALAVEKPAVVSDWPDLRHCFSRGFIHVVNTPEAIAAGIQQMLNECEKLTAEIVAMRSELLARRKPVFEELIQLLKQKESTDLNIRPD
jgi:glycosyltransferase involved in cell wall biosynthesis